MLSLQIFVIAIVCVQDILCFKKVYCDTDDEVCLSNAVKERVFPKLLTGIPGVDPSEPLHLPRLKIDVPNLQFSLLNATMTGVKDCDVRFKKNALDTKFEYQPCCPKLTIESEYEVEGRLDAVAVKGKGTLKITYENFDITIAGNQKKIEFSDCKHHIRILDYTTDLDLKGKSSYDFKNLVFGESGRCKCSPIVKSRYYDRFEEITRAPIMKAFIDKFMENVKGFHVAVPVEDLYYKYV